MKKILPLLATLSLVMLGGCATTAKTTLSGSETQRLMAKPEFQNVLKAEEPVRTWAMDALETVAKLQRDLKLSEVK